MYKRYDIKQQKQTQQIYLLKSDLGLTSISRAFYLSNKVLIVLTSEFGLEKKTEIRGRGLGNLDKMTQTVVNPRSDLHQTYKDAKRFCKINWDSREWKEINF